MDDSDLLMQTERLSQSGSVNEMEVEGEDTHFVRDADMDAEHEDLSQRVHEALPNDEEMAPDIHGGGDDLNYNAGPWQDVDLPVPDPDDTEYPVGQAFEGDTVDIAPIGESSQGVQLGTGEQQGATVFSVDPVMNNAVSTINDSTNTPTNPINDHVEAQPAGGVTVHHYTTVDGRDEVGSDTAGASQSLAENRSGQAVPDSLPEPHTHSNTDETEPHSATVLTADGAQSESEKDQTKPVLQKEFLEHVNLFSSDDEDSRWTPHVYLIYDNLAYSLFRSSSSPSGDDEQILFGGDSDHHLYFDSLEIFISSLHQAFPDLSADGEKEIILDFGILEMQIGEDNVYAKQLSLYDFDRIRAGMCQPELDRLQINVLVGKRFVQRFNELAEHCYRMHAGSDEDDEGTVQGDPLTAGDAEEAEQYEDAEYQEAEPAADYVTGSNVEDLDEEEQATELEDAATELDELQQGYEASESVPGTSSSRINYDAASEHTALQTEEELQPPSDDHYEDGEFGAEDEGEDGGEGEEVEAVEDDAYQVVPSYNEQVAEVRDDAADGGSQAGVITDAEQEEHERQQDGQDDYGNDDDEEYEEIEEYVEPIDPEASLDEAAEQAEAYDEAVADAEEADEEEGEANAHLNGDSSYPTYTSAEAPTDPAPEEESSKYYHQLASPTNEEIVLVEHPGNGASSTQVQATVIGDNDSGHIEENADADPGRVLKAKRSRNGLDNSDDETAEEAGFMATHSPTATKRPKIDT